MQPYQRSSDTNIITTRVNNQIAFVDVAPEDTLDEDAAESVKISIDVILFNTLHYSRMYPTMDENSNHIGYFEPFNATKGIFITLGQYTKYNNHQQFIADKFLLA